MRTWDRDIAKAKSGTPVTDYCNTADERQWLAQAKSCTMSENWSQCRSMMKINLTEHVLINYIESVRKSRVQDYSKFWVSQKPREELFSSTE